MMQERTSVGVSNSNLNSLDAQIESLADTLQAINKTVDLLCSRLEPVRVNLPTGNVAAGTLRSTDDDRCSPLAARIRDMVGHARAIAVGLDNLNASLDI